MANLTRLERKTEDTYPTKAMARGVTEDGEREHDRLVAKQARTESGARKAKGRHKDRGRKNSKRTK